MSAAGKGKPKSPEHRQNISMGQRGKPKPWLVGENNPNHQNKAQGQPAARARFLKAVKDRGQAWSADERERHRKRMLGASNAMRGRRHTLVSRAAISAAKKQQYAEGKVKFRRFKVSAPEREIRKYLEDRGVAFLPQYHIPGVPYLYDIYIPHLNLLVEYQGDYWHANPAKYPSGTCLKMQNKGVVLVDTIWARDAAKKAAAEDHGFKVMYVWETEYKKCGMSVVEQLL